MTPTFQGRRPGVPAQRTAEQRATLREHYTPTQELDHDHCATTSAGARSTTRAATYSPHGCQVPSNSGATDGGSIGPGAPAPARTRTARSGAAMPTGNIRAAGSSQRRLRPSPVASGPAIPALGQVASRTRRPPPPHAEEPLKLPRARPRTTAKPPRRRGTAAPPRPTPALRPRRPRQPAPPPPREGREGPAAAGATQASPGDALGRRRGGGEERWGRGELRRRKLPGRSRERLRS
nr:uncharacterized protein LOC127329365 [Lolium perenne]